jgi:hypothetical protein
MSTGYGPSLADQGYSQSDIADLDKERAEQSRRNCTRTGWALPEGMENDYRAREHLFNGGGMSACGRWPTPRNANFEASPITGNGCSECVRHDPRERLVSRLMAPLVSLAMKPAATPHPHDRSVTAPSSTTEPAR